MINYENAVCGALNIPAIPKKEWDGKKSFKKGVAVLDVGDGMQSYAIATFDNEKDKEPRIIKVFALEQFKSISKVLVVPDYMDDDVESMDLDDESKAAAQAMLEEAQELENEGVNDTTEYDNLPEWIFPELEDKEHAIAWLTDYRKRHKIRGKVPTSDESVKLCLLTIYSDEKKGKVKRKKK